MDITTAEKQINVIIFSYNRASQLHACLSSFYENFKCKTEPKVSVLWKASTQEYKNGYSKTMKAFSQKENLVWKEEYNFQTQLIHLVQEAEAEFIMFLVDDDVFVNKVSLGDKQFNLLSNNNSIVAVSLRLHKGVNHCYPTDTDTNVPKFVKGMVWPWAKYQGDWGYPMSVDGNVYRTEMIKNIVPNVNFKNPNTFEVALDMVSKQPGFPQYLCCYLDGPRLFNIPANLVQTQYNNKIFGDISAQEINTKYLSGQIIDYNSYVGMLPNTVHVPVKLNFVQE